jgi:hypothetical protein
MTFTLFLISKANWKISRVRILSCGLLLAIFFLSFHFELDTEIAAGKSTYSSIAKVRKNGTYNHGERPEVALIMALVNCTPNFHPSFFRVLDKQHAPAWYLLRSSIIRAPPFTHSL